MKGNTASYGRNVLCNLFKRDFISFITHIDSWFYSESAWGKAKHLQEFPYQQEATQQSYNFTRKFWKLNICIYNHLIVLLKKNYF